MRGLLDVRWLLSKRWEKFEARTKHIETALKEPQSSDDSLTLSRLLEKINYTKHTIILFQRKRFAQSFQTNFTHDEILTAFETSAKKPSQDP